MSRGPLGPGRQAVMVIRHVKVSRRGWERRIIPYSNQVRIHIHIMTYQQVFTIYEEQVGKCMSVIQLAVA